MSIITLHSGFDLSLALKLT